MKNKLFMVGIGIKYKSHLTTEVKSCIEQADKVLYLVNEPAMQEWIKIANTNAESLDHLYSSNSYRIANYKQIANYVCDTLDKTELLCFVMYGHPTVLANPSTYTVAMAKQRGHEVTIMPGISSENCLYADLAIDPISSGAQLFEATDFLIYDRIYDSSCHLILFQSSMIGVKEKHLNQSHKKGLEVLTEHLLKKYPKNHPTILYEAAQYPQIDPSIRKINLFELPLAEITSLTTIYISPSHAKTPNEFYINKLNSLI